MILIFGYGSLVNRKTWDFQAEYFKCSIIEWKRHWGQAIQVGQRLVSALTVHPQHTANLRGILIKTDAETCKMIDIREMGYKRVSLPSDCVKLQNRMDESQIVNGSIYTYTSDHIKPHRIRKKPVILQSYIDVVADGFYNEFGERGFWEFFEDTLGWELQILNDRNRPLYPRAVDIPKTLLKMIDHAIMMKKDNNL